MNVGCMTELLETLKADNKNEKVFSLVHTDSGF